MGTKRVLIIEPDDDVRDAIGSLLSRSGFDIVKAKSPDDCYENIQIADLVLLEPAYQCAESCKRLLDNIAELDRCVPVLVLTRAVVKELELSAHSAVFEIHNKPVALDVLVEAINRMFGH